jgi:hypothetical protein
MRKIKNDPTKYVKRADLLPKRGMRLQRNSISKSRERDFLTVPIDDRGYVDFSRTSKSRK